MNAFAETVEAHTAYMLESSTSELKMNISASFGGIGATLQDDYKKQGGTRLLESIKGGPKGSVVRLLIVAAKDDIGPKAEEVLLIRDKLIPKRRKYPEK